MLEPKRLRQIVPVAALVLAFVHLVWPSIAVDAITITLLFIAVVPWLAPLFKSLEFPGGWKVEFHDLQKAAARADSAGLLSTAMEAASQDEHLFQRVAEQDPNLALAGLRIEIEKRLVSLAQERGIDARKPGIGTLLRLLSEKQVFNSDEWSVLLDLVGLLNNAVHGAKVDHRAATWAIETGPRLLRALDQKLVDAKLFRS